MGRRKSFEQSSANSLRFLFCFSLGQDSHFETCGQRQAVLPPRSILPETYRLVGIKRDNDPVSVPRFYPVIGQQNSGSAHRLFQLCHAASCFVRLIAAVREAFLPGGEKAPWRRSTSQNRHRSFRQSQPRRTCPPAPQFSDYKALGDGCQAVARRLIFNRQPGYLPGWRKLCPIVEPHNVRRQINYLHIFSPFFIQVLVYLSGDSRKP